MYCKNCGSKHEDGDSFCKYCGTKIAESNETVESNPIVNTTPTVETFSTNNIQKQDNPAQTLSVLGFVFSFFCALAGLIISAIALKKYKTQTVQDGKGLAVAGLVISIVSVAISIIYFLAIVAEIVVEL